MFSYNTSENPTIKVNADKVSEGHKFVFEDNGIGIEESDVLMISCLIRFHSFGPLFTQEVDSIYNLWEKPMAGFLSYGEIGNTGDQKIAEFHNAT